MKKLLLALLLLGLCAGASAMETEDIRAVAMACDTSARIPDNLLARYEEAASWGFNAVTIHLQGELLESKKARGVYREEGFAYLDAHMEAARAAGMGVILHLYGPTVGVQGTQEGQRLWAEESEQDLFLALWEAVAARYAEEPVLIGYGLLGEPCLPMNAAGEPDPAAWQRLAQRAAEAIRAHDARHTIFVECAYACETEFGRADYDDWADPNLGFVQIEDDNWALEAHFYEPYAFTHQEAYAQWGSYQPNLAYPSEYLAAPTWEIERLGTDYPAPAFDPADPTAQYLQGAISLPTDERANMARLSFEVYGLGEEGWLAIEEWMVERVDLASGESESLLYLGVDDPVPLSWWSEDGTGYAEDELERSAVMVQGGDGLLTVTLEGADLPLTEDAGLRVSATVSGWQVPAGVEARLRVDYFYNPRPFRADGEYVRASLARYADYAAARGLDVYLGGFGVCGAAFDNLSGAENWLRDVYAVLREEGMGYSFFAYDDPYFGPYRESGANTALIDLLKEENAR